MTPKASLMDTIIPNMSLGRPIYVILAELGATSDHQQASILIDEYCDCMDSNR